MTNLATIPAIMRKIYDEEYHLFNRDFHIVAFMDRGNKITVKIYEVIGGKVTIIPQFEASLLVNLSDEGNIANSPMFQKIIDASKLFLQNFQ